MFFGQYSAIILTMIKIHFKTNDNMERVKNVFSDIFGKDVVDELFDFLTNYMDGFQERKLAAWDLSYFLFILCSIPDEKTVSNHFDEMEKYSFRTIDLVTKISERLKDPLPDEKPDLLFLESVEISTSFVNFRFQGGISYLYGKQLPEFESKTISGDDFRRIFILNI